MLDVGLDIVGDLAGSVGFRFRIGSWFMRRMVPGPSSQATISSVSVTAMVTVLPAWTPP
jgi:hypothetical protein